MAIDKLGAVGENLLVAVGYGDSAGLPAETLTPEQIQDKFGRLSGLIPIDNKFMGKHPIGRWSDDTKLSLAIAEALIDSEGFNMKAIATNHVGALRDPVNRGWGSSTRKSIKRLRKDGSWRTSGSQEGEGNGVLMKLSPLALWQTVKQPVAADNQVEAIARMTHANTLSVVTALVHRDILGALLMGYLEPADVPQAGAAQAEMYEQHLGEPSQVTSGLLGRLALDRRITDRTIADLTPKAGFWSPETLVMAYGAFARTPHYPDNIYDVINLGGDTDSTGSIVGAMSAMHQGDLEHPADVAQLEQVDYLRKVGQELVAMLS
ncbi:MAG: Poly(ADP-ribose) glycohydrolase [Candidatus Saccharibacteria bacterium]|nr:Poly(ADP-ribose) glycohydrolase [Candidatus Saccharibacteria bacterium]